MQDDSAMRTIVLILMLFYLKSQLESEEKSRKVKLNVLQARLVVGMPS